MSRRIGGGAIAVLLFLPACLHAGGYTPIHPPLPVGAFELTERNGSAVSSESLRGKVWVAHFFFTSCRGPCNKTLPEMQKLQQLFAGKPDVALVSVTVDSEFDKPEVLRDFATHWEADPEQWLFLTGSEEQVHDIVKKCFAQGVDRNPSATDRSEAVIHSARLLLIDRNGMIRGYVDGQDPEAVQELARQVRSVAAEKYVLPAVNASLNGLCAVLLVVGYVAIRRRHETLHIVSMVCALVVSAVFLSCYLYFHFAIQHGKPTAFPGQGLIRGLYFTILLTHTVLAVAVAPLALYVAYQGVRDQRRQHVRFARWTLPIWLYVSVTGVVVYWMLYQLYPPY